MTRTVLISGAGIAGPALAHWLRAHGMTPTVVERAPGVRPGGQTVDLRGAGRTVVERMGLEPAVRERLTHERGLHFVDGAGRVRATFGADSFDGAGFVIDLEILRGELADLLHAHTSADTEYVFDDEITALDDTGDHVRVSFRTGPDRVFDLVVLADGLRSRTRDLVFADLTHHRGLGLHTAYFTIPREPGDDDFARWYNAPGGRSAVLRPDNLGTVRASLSFRSAPGGVDRLGVPAQKRFLREHYADAGWQTPRVLAGMEAGSDFYFEAIGQVRLDRWSRGRVAVLGDAAYCPSPLSGMGTSLALVGAYVLAGELARHDDHAAGFAAYERVMRPYATQAQKVSSLAPRLATPQTRTGIRVLHRVLDLATKPALTRVGAHFATPPADAIDLPDYAVASA